MKNEPIADCSACGSPGRVQHPKSEVPTYMIVPARIKDCELHKNPERRCGGSLSAMCRSGMCTSRDSAIRQWNVMQGNPTVRNNLYSGGEHLNKDEFFDVYRIFLPDATREDFERDWNEFQELKREHLRKLALQ